MLLWAICYTYVLIFNACLAVSTREPESHSLLPSIERQMRNGQVPYYLDTTDMDLLSSIYSLSPINRDPEYMIFNQTVDTMQGESISMLWRQVRMGAYYFTFNNIALRPFWHTYLILADDAFYNEYPGSGSRGWDLSKFDDGTFYLRLESDTLPKTDMSPRDRRRFPHLHFRDLCYTRRSDQEIRHYAVQFRGKYSILGRNCLDYTYYLMKFVCGRDVAVQAMQQYRLALNAVYKPLRRLKEAHLLPEFKEREWDFVEHPKNATLRDIRREHYQQVFDPVYTYTERNKKRHWWQFWKWQMWQKLNPTNRKSE